MKTVKKKLKAKRFRYLGKEYVQNPMDYIKWFYQKYDLNTWQEQVYVFLTKGSDLRRPSQPNPSHTHEHMVNHLDIAYILSERGQCTGIAVRFLDYIFELNCRQYWLETMDELLKNETDINYWHDTDNYNLYLVNFIEIFHYLNHYFYLISTDRETDFQLPLYVLPKHMLTDEEKLITDCQTRIPELPNNIDSSNVAFYHREQVALPEWLTPQPYSKGAVKDFFQICCLSNWREQLWRWYQAVITEDLYWSAEDRAYSGANLLYDYACIYALLDMYRSQSYDTPRTNYTFDDIHPRSIFKECAGVAIVHDSEEITLHYVQKEELADPLSAILSLINEYGKVEWDEILYDWLSFGLSANALSDERYSCHGTHIYQVLVKIVELSYLLAFEGQIEMIEQTKMVEE